MDQLHVEISGLIKSLSNGFFGDLVKHHPLDRHFGSQQLQQMPADAFALSIFVSCQQQLISLLQSCLQLLDHLLFVLRNHIKRFEIRGGVHAKVGPFLPLLGRRDLTGVVGQVAHMAHGGLHTEVLGQKPSNGSRLGRAFDNDQSVRHRRYVTVPIFIAPASELHDAMFSIRYSKAAQLQSRKLV
ncbi:MAG: Uncharacterised protein [Prochlorococcus marinus str. MIT 9313]|nr:MAG: Uncharacterised protein [Prochlorococcus marinus str. MIT 9313]